MKLQEIAVFLQEKLFAVTGTGVGIVDHTHRVDFSVREGRTTVDDKHYHMYRLGDSLSTKTIRVPPEAPVKDHDHTLPALLKESPAEPEKILHFLRTLEKEDFQSLANPLNEPKRNMPLNLQVEDRGREGIKVSMVFYKTKDAYAVETIGRHITPMIKELGVHPNRVHYHVIPYRVAVEPMDGEEPLAPEVDFEHVGDKQGLTMVVAILSDHMMKGS